MAARRILGFPHRPQPHGGPGSFQLRLSAALQDRGFEIVFPDSGVQPDVVMVLPATRKIDWLWKCKRNGARIVQRLDGIHWRHRYTPIPWKTRLVLEGSNWLIRLIRNHLADAIVYQSHFVKSRWYEMAGPSRRDERVIHNAVDLSEFHPQPSGAASELPHLLCVEGVVNDCDAYLRPLEFLAGRLFDRGLIKETIVCGDAGEPTPEQQSFYREKNVRMLGRLPRGEMPEVFRNALYLVLEVHPPCPNSVVESLASGAPVVGYDTGSLRELISAEGGITVPYGTDSWKLEVPDLQALEPAAVSILEHYDEYSRSARKRAEEEFDIDRMVEKYLEVLDP